MDFISGRSVNWNAVFKTSPVSARTQQHLGNVGTEPLELCFCQLPLDLSYTSSTILVAF
jgi:hypothetical protein